MKKIKILNKIISESLKELSDIKCEISMMKEDMEFYQKDWEDVSIIDNDYCRYEDDCHSFMEKCIKEYKIALKDKSEINYNDQEIRKAFKIVEQLTGVSEFDFEEICIINNYILYDIEDSISNIIKKISLLQLHISLLQLPSND